jgi:glucosamine--fructose-6-phosphate aminotransferase (isomerizing)
MCGIVGFLGKRNVKRDLLNGLRALEYRGYESAGLAIMNATGEISVAKAATGVESLGDLFAKVENLEMLGAIGIAHTRWPTHGGATEGNCHPHCSCDGSIWLVHNGVVENFQELRAMLIEKGHKIVSETDTELVAHLIEEEMKGVSLESAVRAALPQIKGSFALAIICRAEPDKIIIARRTSPLLIGHVGVNEFIIASDSVAILPHTKEIYELHDDELGILMANGCEYKTFKGARLAKEQIDVDTELELVDKCGYKHMMLKEIFEQPDVVANVCRGRLLADSGKVKLGGLEKNLAVVERLKEIDRVIIVACGTAYYAGALGALFFNRVGVQAEAQLASEFLYSQTVYDPRRTMVLAVSQSGETADTIRALEEAKIRGALTVAIVNRVGSRMTRMDDCGIYTRAGFEIGVASTKGFSSQLTVLAMMMLYFGRERGKMALGQGQLLVAELLQMPDKMKKVLAKVAEIEKLAQRFSQATNFLFLGRGYSYPMALEGALKLKEVSYVHSEGYASGEMKHGPIALLDENFPVVAIAPRDGIFDKTKSNIMEVAARKAPLIVITTEDCTDFDQLTEFVIKVPTTKMDCLTPLLTVLPLQLFAYFMAVNRGLNPDKPRNLAKSVTVE